MRQEHANDPFVRFKFGFCFEPSVDLGKSTYFGSFVFFIRAGSRAGWFGWFGWFESFPKF